MIGAIAQQYGQYRTGLYLGLTDVVDDASAPFFTYEEVAEKEKRYNQVIQNLITHENSIVIKSNYYYDWKNQAKVRLQDGKLYMIINIKEIEDDINPQALATMIASADTIYYLELLGIDESD